MLNSVLFIIIILCQTIQSITKKEYDKKISNGAFTFSAASILFASIFFAVGSKNIIDISKEALLYGVGFSIAYTVTTVAMFYAIHTGPLSLTTLFTSYSLLIPTLYGLLVCKEPITYLVVIGIILQVISIFFVNIEKREGPQKLTLKWVVFVFLSFVGNGACSVIQKLQQDSACGQYKNEFMSIGLLISFAVTLVFALVYERKDIVSNLKKGFLNYSLCGLGNGAVNFLVLILLNRVATSVMFPIISGGSIIITILVSLVTYKERLSKFQSAGILMGIGSIVLLNL